MRIKYNKQRSPTIIELDTVCIESDTVENTVEYRVGNIVENRATLSKTIVDKRTEADRLLASKSNSKKRTRTKSSIRSHGLVIAAPSAKGGELRVSADSIAERKIVASASGVHPPPSKAPLPVPFAQASAFRGTKRTRSASSFEQRSAKPQAVTRSVLARSPQGSIGLESVMSQIYRETKRYLDTLARAASEGRAVDEANNFLRWLQFSGVCRLVEMFGAMDESFLKLRGLATDLQDVCLPHLQGRNIKPHPSQARIDEVNDKLDFILSQMAKPSPPFQHTPVVGSPALLVIAGGVSSDG